MDLHKVKALFFAQYLMQPVLRCISRPIETFIVLPFDCTRSETTNFLILRTVNQLTDEECISIGASIGWGFTNSNKEQVLKWMREDLDKEKDRYSDLLRLYGILTRFTYVDETGKPVTKSVEEIITLNWAKIK